MLLTKKIVLVFYSHMCSLFLSRSLIHTHTHTQPDNLLFERARAQLKLLVLLLLLLYGT